MAAKQKPWEATDLKFCCDIGNGTFGTIYKAIGNEDNTVFYSVNKIPLNNCNPDNTQKKPENTDIMASWIGKLTQEVNKLATLRNEFVVRHFYCWFEGPGPNEETLIYKHDDISNLLTSGLSSNNILNNFYIVMDYCETDLRKWLNDNNSRGELRGNLKQDVCSFFTQILEGLDYIHGLGLVHFDIKPENIMIKGTLQVQIGNFGLSTLGPLASNNRLYMSPELVENNGGITSDYKTDIYSTGLIFFEIINHLLQDSDRRLSTFVKIRNGTYTFPTIPIINQTGNPKPSGLQDAFGLIKKMTHPLKEHRLKASDCLKQLRENTTIFQSLILYRKNLKLPWEQNQLKFLVELGKGGFGTVYKAWGYLDDTIYAVKKISVHNFMLTHYSQNATGTANGWYEKVKLEVKTLVNLHSPFVVRYYACWFEGPRADIYDTGRSLKSIDEEFSSTNEDNLDFFYIKMEFCEYDLREWLKRNNSLSKRDGLKIRKIFTQVLKGLEYIHDEKGIIHRDIKPDNIMIKEESPSSLQIKIGDFGLSKLVTRSPSGDDGDQNHLTGLKTVGTQSYRSPEMEIAERGSSSGYNFKTDIYSAGLSFLEVINPELIDMEKRKRAFGSISVGTNDFQTELKTGFEKEVALIKKMTMFRKDFRPSAKEALEILEAENDPSNFPVQNAGHPNNLLSTSMNSTSNENNVYEGAASASSESRPESISVADLSRIFYEDLEMCRRWKEVLPDVLDLKPYIYVPIIDSYLANPTKFRGSVLELVRSWRGKTYKKDATIGFLLDRLRRHSLTGLVEILEEKFTRDTQVVNK